MTWMVTGFADVRRRYKNDRALCRENLAQVTDEPTTKGVGQHAWLCMSLFFYRKTCAPTWYTVWQALRRVTCQYLVCMQANERAHAL